MVGWSVAGWSRLEPLGRGQRLWQLGWGGGRPDLPGEFIFWIEMRWNQEAPQFPST